MVLKIGEVAGCNQRRFDPTLLSDEQFANFLQEHISHFITDNDTGDVNESTLWEALKAVIKGHIIAFVSKKRRAEGSRLKDIERDLSIQEDSYKKTPKDPTLGTITNLKYEYNTILSQRVGSLLAQTQHKYFELGDKPHSLLARQLRHTQATRAIHKIRDNRGNLKTDPLKINKAFASFYEDMYQSRVSHTDSQKMNNFLENSQLPKLDETAAEAMDADITLDEIQTAISHFLNNKASGPEGFTIELYEKYSSTSAPLLLRMFTHS